MQKEVAAGLQTLVSAPSRNACANAGPQKSSHATSSQVMEIPMRRIFSSLLFSCAFAAFLPLGCDSGSSAGCKEYCQVVTKCCALRNDCSDIADIPSCTATCVNLSKNADYQQALEDEASCQQGKSCDEIVYQGACVPKP